MLECVTSDFAIVAVKTAKNANFPYTALFRSKVAAEPGERRAGTKGNAGQQSTCRAQNRISVSQALERIRQFAVIHLRWEKLWGGAAEVVAPSSSIRTDGGCPVPQVNDLSRSLAAFDPISTLVVVVEMSKTSWLVSGVVPGVERQPLKKLEPDATALLRLIERWRIEAVRAGRPIRRIALAYEAGRDGFWLARWLIARGIEAHVIHSASIAVTRERKRAKTYRLDAAILMRVFLGWLRGERGSLRAGGNPDDGGRGCEAPKPRAREPCQRAFTRRQPHEECACPFRDPGIQATSAQSARASSMSADSGGHGPTGKHHRGAPARHGTAGIGP